MVYKVTQKDWDRMQSLINKSTEGDGVARTIKDVDKAVARYVTGNILHGVKSFSTCYRFGAFYDQAISLGAKEEDIEETFNAVYVPYKEKKDAEKAARDEQLRIVAEIHRKEEEIRKIKEEEERQKHIEHLNSIKTKKEYLDNVSHYMTNDECKIFFEKFGGKLKFPIRVCNTWHTWRGRIGNTAITMNKWSESKQSWGKDLRYESHPDWRPLVHLQYTYSFYLPIVGDHCHYGSVDKYLQSWEEIREACSNSDETFTMQVCKHPIQ